MVNMVIKGILVILSFGSGHPFDFNSIWAIEMFSIDRGQLDSIEMDFDRLSVFHYRSRSFWPDRDGFRSNESNLHRTSSFEVEWTHFISIEVILCRPSSILVDWTQYESIQFNLSRLNSTWIDRAQLWSIELIFRRSSLSIGWKSNRSTLDRLDRDWVYKEFVDRFTVTPHLYQSIEFKTLSKRYFDFELCFVTLCSLLSTDHYISLQQVPNRTTYRVIVIVWTLIKLDRKSSYEPLCCCINQYND